MAAPTKQEEMISSELIRDVVERISDGGPVRRALPYSGRLYVDRKVPFLCLYRRPVNGWDEGTDKLVTGMASYLVGSQEKRIRKSQTARNVEANQDSCWWPRCPRFSP